MAKEIGTRLKVATQEILDLFTPIEGQVAFYYGRIRNGKTYSATADILDLLDRGEVVFANWKVDWQGIDERQNMFRVWQKLLTGKKYFFHYKPDNFYYFHPDHVDVRMLGRLVNAHIFIDEGQWLFNSQVREQDPDKRRLILHNGHHCRSLNIISQRPSNVFKDMRSQVHIWYKCEKRLSWPWLVFQRTAFEDMKDDVPDEESTPTSVKVYFANKRVLQAYNTHAMREKDAIEKVPQFETWELSAWDKVVLLFSLMFKGKQGAGAPAPAFKEKKPYKPISEHLEPLKRLYVDDKS